VGQSCSSLILSIPSSLRSLFFPPCRGGIQWSSRHQANRFGVAPSKSTSNYFPILGSLGQQSKCELESNLSRLGKTFRSQQHAEIIGWARRIRIRRRKVLISNSASTRLSDWKIKVKIGGLGVCQVSWARRCRMWT